MIARAPIWAAVMWLATTMSPLLVMVIPLALGAPAFVTAATLFLAFMAGIYIYLSLIRHTRRRVMQSLIRAKALTEEKPYIVISRSYAQSTAFQTSVPIPGVPGATIGMFEALIYDLSYRHPVVVLGNKDLSPDDPAGRAVYMAPWVETPKSFAFNAETNEFFKPPPSWQDTFAELGRRARFILLIPSLSDGLVTEIELLKSRGLGSKTVVYMWPARGQCANGAISARPEDWEQLRAPLATHGLVLPPHIPQGALLCLDDQFAIRATHSPVPPLNVLDSVERSNDGQAHTPLREVAPMIEAYEIMSNADRYEHMWRFARMEQR